MGLDFRQSMALFAGWTIMLIHGALYAYGGIAPYLVSDLYYKGNKDISSSKLTIVLTISMITTNFGMFLSSLKIFKFNYRITAFIAILGISASTYTLSYVTNLSQYILLYGICFGTFIGFGYLAGVRNCYDYLPTQKGLCSGVCMMGFGLGPVIIIAVFTQFVNPNNLKYGSNYQYPIQVASKVPQSLRTLAMVYLCIGMLGVVLLKPMSQHQKKKAHHHPPPPPPPLQQKLIEMQPMNHLQPGKQLTQQEKLLLQSLKPQVAAEVQKRNIILQMFSKMKGIGIGLTKGIGTTLDKTLGTVLKQGILKNLNTNTYDMPQYMGNIEIALPQAPKANDSYAAKKRYQDKKKQIDIVHQLNEQSITLQLFGYLFQKEVHILVVILSLSSSFGLFLAFNYKTFGFYEIHDDQYMSLIGICGSLVNGFSRLMWGMLLDRYSFRVITTIINSVLLVGCVAADYAVSHKLAYLILVTVVYGCFGGNYSIYGPQTYKIIGKAVGSRVYFFIYFGFSLGAILQYICCIFFIQPYGRDGYTYCFIIMAGLLILAIFYGVTVDFPKYQQSYHHQLQNQQKENKENKEEKQDEMRLSAKQKSRQNIQKIMNN